LYREQNIVLSPFNDDGTSHYFASKMFIGAASVGPFGFMQSDLILLQAQRRLIARAHQLILLVDSTKFGGPIGEGVCPLSEVTTVITDNRIASAHAKLVERSGAILILVNVNCEPEE
jgi:DeoR family transcriptional regulator, ulaG and ulaABCDEF operon transcriptional repressor